MTPPLSTLFPYTTLFRSTFKKFSTRTMRPVVDFDTCIKCTLCWLQCPDSCFDVTPDGLYDANMQESGHCSQRSEEHASELQSHSDLVCRLLLEKKNKTQI